MREICLSDVAGAYEDHVRSQGDIGRHVRICEIADSLRAKRTRTRVVRDREEDNASGWRDDLDS